MADMTIEEFCARHGACQEVREWALANCQSMRDVWDTAKPQWLMWVATRRGVLTERDLRLFTVRCARSVEHLMTDQRSRHAIVVGERFAFGNADADELAAARQAAWDAMPAPSLGAYSACSVAWAATWHASDEDAAWVAARDAAQVASLDTAREQQAEWLRELTPRFDRQEATNG